MLPLVLNGINPFMQFAKVDLPLPEAPTTNTFLLDKYQHLYSVM